jgi:serine/threonine protein kinase
MSADPKQVKSIFLAAIEFTGAARAAYLDEACGSDQVLRKRVEELLQAHDERSGDLQQPALTHPASDDRAGENAEASVSPGSGSRIGPYKLLQQIGEGGMGTVWMAEQTEPVRRMVALKVIKPGMDSAQVMARFEAERQALALMDHPNVAKVLDAGTTEAGRPFFVMELVKGISITKYCDDHQLTPRERLELFVDVCHAIQHAHQKGIIHRDIKPSNVLVASYDGKPVPKIIDFGVAKATGQRLTERTLFTGFGGMVGTLEYMSPEQAEFNALDIDTRSDIYALGVLLYELLTGTTPLTRKRLKQAALEEALRLIREVEPPKPSTRLSESKDSLPAVAAQRKMEPAKLTKLVRGDLDWLVMKSLEKDRNRRYETANGLALDIQRYLHDEPVLARPPSAIYRLRKFAKRNKGPLAAAALVLLAMVAGIIGTTLGLLEAQAQRDVAVQARADEADQRQLAERQRDRAIEAERSALSNELKAKEEEAHAKASEQRALTKEKEARAVLDFFENKVLAAARPKGQEGGLGIDATIKAAVDEADLRLADSFADQPLVEASICNVLGGTNVFLGDHGAAIRHHKRALELRKAELGPEHPDTLQSIGNLAETYLHSGSYLNALPLLEENLRMRKATLGSDNPRTLESMNNLAAVYLLLGRLKEGLMLAEETCRIRKAKFGLSHPETLTSINNLAASYSYWGRHQEAVALLEETLALADKTDLGHDHPDVLGWKHNLAIECRYVDRLKDALVLAKETLELYKTQLGPDHPQTISCMETLASSYLAAGALNAALSLHEDALRLRKAKLGPDHPDTMKTMNNLADTYWRSGRRGDNVLLQEQLLQLRQDKLGPDHPDTLHTMNALGAAYRETGRLTDGIRLLEETLKRSKLGPDHPSTFITVDNLIQAYEKADRGADVLRMNAVKLKLLEEALILHKTNLGPEHPKTLETVNILLGAYQKANRPEDVARLREERLKLIIPAHADDPKVLTELNLYAQLFRNSGRRAEIARLVPLFQDALEVAKAKWAQDDPKTLALMNNLADAYWDAGRRTENIAVQEQLFKLRQAKLGANHNDTLVTLNALGMAYLDTGRLTDALPLLEQALKLRRAKPPANAPTTLLSINNLALAYETAGRHPDAERLWRELVEIKKQQAGVGSLAYAIQLAALGRNLALQNKYADAESILHQSLAISDSKYPNDWNNFNAKALLGATFLAQKKYDAAEPLLLEGYEGMKQRVARIPQQSQTRLLESLEQIVKLYEATDQADKAKRWQKVLQEERDKTAK